MLVISDIVNLEAEGVEEIEIEEVQGGVEEKENEKGEEEKKEDDEEEERYGVGHGLSEYDVVKRQRYIENKGYVYNSPTKFLYALQLLYLHHLVAAFCFVYILVFRGIAAEQQVWHHSPSSHSGLAAWSCMCSSRSRERSSPPFEHSHGPCR